MSEDLVEKTIHREFKELAKKFYKEHGIKVLSVSFQWSYLRTMSQVLSDVTEVSVHTETQD